MKKKLFSMILTLSLVLSLFPAASVLAEPNTYWSGSGIRDVSWYGDGSADTFTVSTPAALGGFAYLVNSGTSFQGKTVTLGADISLSGHYWTPIGNLVCPFKGAFNGAGHSISGMSIVTMAECNGFFGSTKGALLLNISLSGAADVVYDRDNQHTFLGGIVGTAYGTVIENCSYTGSVSFTCTAATPSGDAYGIYVGGLAGYIGSSDSPGSPANAPGCIANCSVVGDVTITSPVGHYNGFAGGLTGQADAADITNSYHRGDVTSNMCWYNNTAGGLAGILDGSASMYNCYAAGTASAAGATVNQNDPIAFGPGTAEHIFCDDSVNDGFITAAVFNAWVGTNGNANRTWRDDTGSENGGFPLFADSTWQVTLSGNGGYHTQTRGSYTYCRFFEAHYVDKGGSYTLPSDTFVRPAYALSGWAASPSGAPVSESSITPSGSLLLYAQWQEAAAVPYTGQDAPGRYSISTAAQLAKLSDKYSHTSGYTNTLYASIFTLTADINLAVSDSFDLNADGDTLDAGESWPGGSGWTPIGPFSDPVSGVTFDGAGHQITGMTIVSATDSDTSMLGLFGIVCAGTIKNLYVSGSVNLSTGPAALNTVYAGGIAGMATQTAIVNCGTDVDISVTYSNGLSVAEGGIAGVLNSNSPTSVLNCYATGDLLVSGTITSYMMGGIAGVMLSEDIRNCYFAGSIHPDGIPLDPESEYAMVGGIAGGVYFGIISHCYYLPDGDRFSLTGMFTDDSTLEGCGTFTGSSGALTPEYGHTLSGTDLLSALNAWIKAQPDSGRYRPWYVVAAYNGAYPQFAAPPTGGNTPISDTGDSGLPLLLTLTALAALAAGVILVAKRRRG